MLKRIHINKHIIRANAKHNKNDPPITVKTYKENVKCFDVVIRGDSVVVYRPDSPMSCGARVWIETTSPVYATKEHGEVRFIK